MAGIRDKVVHAFVSTAPAQSLGDLIRSFASMLFVKYPGWMIFGLPAKHPSQQAGDQGPRRNPPGKIPCYARALAARLRVQISNKFISERNANSEHAVTSEDEAHFRVLAAIEKNPDFTQRELAEQLGLSLGKTNFLVNALLEKGAIKMENFRRSETKLKKIAYLLTPSGIAERLRLTQGYLARKRTEYVTLKAEIEALERETAHPPVESAERSDPIPCILTLTGAKVIKSS